MNSTEEDNFKKEQVNEKNISQANINSDNINSKETKIDKKLIEIEDKYRFGWSGYSEITNGRFAMLGFLAIIIIELFSHQSFLKWAGIL